MQSRSASYAPAHASQLVRRHDWFTIAPHTTLLAREQSSASASAAAAAAGSCSSDSNISGMFTFRASLKHRSQLAMAARFVDNS
jgi:hypothetical protein